MRDPTKYFAHSNQGPPDEWHLLEDHLGSVAEQASEFAKAFSSSAWGYLAGLWHDAGKYQAAFQEKLRGRSVKVEHSGAGAALAQSRFSDQALPLAFAIAGHHVGLCNLASGEIDQPLSLKERLAANERVLDDILPVMPPHLLPADSPEMPPFLKTRAANSGEVKRLRRSCELWVRFLFSALVDADRLDTENFLKPCAYVLRSGFSPLDELSERLDRYIQARIAAVSGPAANSRVNAVRNEVLHACRETAGKARGVFTLTVPTGGGKTLSAMSFALRHAIANSQRRVIVVIPYTSIIEQNALEYKKALGSNNDIEHHSSYDPGTDDGEDAAISERHRLAVENWDAPVIVTTSVQFFETLFTSRPSRCRKLHNMAQSVIILDEVQTLPPGLLLSIVEVLNELAANYGCSIVLSTATPPALASRPNFPGLTDIRHIIADPGRLAAELKRVEYVWPGDKSPPLTWPELARELAGYKQVLAVVHLRKDARNLAQELKRLTPPDEVIHLSALMCPAHRLDVMRHIRKRLYAGQACRVVSTQLVEAGVDLDFPAVYRALGNLAGIVQAAGRCNREGLLEKGRVVVFKAPTRPPSGTPRRGLEITEALLRQTGELDPGEPQTIEDFFRRLYFSEALDALNIQMERQSLNFATVGEKFRLIEDRFTISLIVPYEDGREKLASLRSFGPDRELLRALQLYTVSIYPDAFRRLEDAGAVIDEGGGVFSLAPTHEHLYDARYGLVLGDELVDSTSTLVI